MSSSRWIAVLVLLVFVALALGGVVWAFMQSPLTVISAPNRRGPTANREPPYFEDATNDARLAFFHEPGPTGSYFFPEIMGPGGAIFDYDLDGDLDIYLVNGTSGPPHPLAADPAAEGQPPAAGKRGGRLFRHEQGLTFVDVTESSGLINAGYGMGIAVGDVSNDGYPDVYLTNYAGDRFFLNRGDGTFEDQTEAAGIDNQEWGTSASFLDYDRDGRLDLFVTNYVDYDGTTRCKTASQGEDYCHPNQFDGSPGKLYRNLTGGETAQAPAGEGERPAVRFEDVSLASGIGRVKGPGLGVLIGDYNDDGWPDIYVANDSQPNVLWMNRHDGTFEDEAIVQGVAYDGQGKPQASMGVALGDVDLDGDFDMISTNLDGESNTLYLRDPAGGFTDGSIAAGMYAPSLPYTGFGVLFLDLDHDGDLDLPVANGRVMRRQQTPEESAAYRTGNLPTGEAYWNAYREPSLLMVNEGQGQFRGVPTNNSPFSNVSRVARGLASGDLDDDGDLDLLVTSAADRPALLLNVAPKLGHSLFVRATDPALGGRDVYGAIVALDLGGRRLIRQIDPGGSYLSSSDPRAHFGVGTTDRYESIQVRWPDGALETFPGGPVDRTVEVERGNGTPSS